MGLQPIGRGVPTPQHPGFTLLEVMVALALLGLILGVSGLALASLREPGENLATRQLRAARDSSIRSGEVVRVRIPATGSSRDVYAASVTFLPDGRSVGAGVDPLTGDLRGAP